MKNSAKKTNKVIKFGKFRWVAATGIFTLIAALCFVSPPTGDEVYENHFMAYEDNISAELDLMLSTRGAGDDNDESHAAMQLIREGMEHYNKKEYEKAIPIFQEYLDNHKEASDYDEIKFYLAVSFLSQGETARSVNMFEQLTQAEDLELQEDAKWYLSLAYARTGQVDKAKEQLQDLASSEKYAAKAEKILNPTKSKVAFR